MADLDSHLERYYHAAVQRIGTPWDAVRKLTEAIANDPDLRLAAEAKKRDLEALESQMPTPASLERRDAIGFHSLKMLRAVLG